MATKRRNVSKSKSKTLSKSNKSSSSRKHLIKSRKSGTKTRKMRGGVKVPIWSKFKGLFSRAPKPVAAPAPVFTKTPVATPAPASTLIEAEQPRFFMGQQVPQAVSQATGAKVWRLGYGGDE